MPVCSRTGYVVGSRPTRQASWCDTLLHTCRGRWYPGAKEDEGATTVTDFENWQAGGSAFNRLFESNAELLS